MIDEPHNTVCEPLTCDRVGCESEPFKSGWMRRVGSTVDGGRTVPLVHIYCSQECADRDRGGDGA